MNELELIKLMTEIRRKSTELYGHLVAIIEEMAKKLCKK